MMDCDELTVRLQLIRPDLTADIIYPEIQKLAESDTVPAVSHLRYCIQLAMRNQPMPWEDTNIPTYRNFLMTSNNLKATPLNLLLVIASSYAVGQLLIFITRNMI